MDWIEAKNRKSENRHPWELARFEIIHRLMNPLLSLKRPVNIVDIGCGDGYVISRLAHFYPQAKFYGMDTALPEETATTFPANVRFYRSAPDLLGELDRPPGMVLLMDVIEHVSTDSEFLRSIVKDFCDHNTLLVITVPAFPSLFCSHDAYLNHKRRYTRSGLRKTVQEAGLQELHSGSFFFSLLLPRWLRVMKEKIVNNKPAGTALSEWNGSKIKASVFKHLLLLDQKFAWGVKRFSGLMLPGLSIYIICKRSV